MRVKLKLTRTTGAEPEYLYTTLFSIALWEEKFNKKLPDDFMEWLKENPEMDVLPEADVTNPNPTDAALTDGN